MVGVLGNACGFNWELSVWCELFAMYLQELSVSKSNHPCTYKDHSAIFSAQQDRQKVNG